MVTPLRKALYGLKQSPKNWNDTLRQFLNKQRYKDTDFSPGLYLTEEDTCMIAAYVDDNMIAAESEEKIDEIIGKFEEEIELKIVGTMNEGILSTDILID
ncbi:hypothetical protein DAKH74_050900 [Maudiozyma humilis]|uniref:Reverse transcriptase Ty1/copia-type domain-containing protein n=1 Tax=Maudiozyma humilis TaxID=51915 RepID=A0AAV5S401_MAUHU|nr:hypothetical protein DAKH74_050900 [Kazachstania humilis]